MPSFAYDALDRLVYAYTEEQDGTSAGTYTRTYAYDAPSASSPGTACRGK
jgi:hypothetical protein